MKPVKSNGKKQSGKARLSAEERLVELQRSFGEDTVIQEQRFLRTSQYAARSAYAYETVTTYGAYQDPI